MLTEYGAVRLLRLLKQLDARNIDWKVDCACNFYISVFDSRFRINSRGSEKLSRYIDTYDEMVRRVDAGEYILSDKVIEKHISKLIVDSTHKEYIKKEQEKTVDGTEGCVEGELRNEAPKGYNDMVKAALANLKEKCGIRDELMEKLFKVLEYKSRDLLNPDSSNADDYKVQTAPPPPDIVDKGM